MPEIVTDCPRCGAKDHTFLVNSMIPTYTGYGWERHFEAFCLCKNCCRSTIFSLVQKEYDDNKIFSNPEKLKEYKLSYNNILKVDGYLNLRSMASRAVPEHVPDDIAKIFKEGAESVVGKCPNAAASMFRLCVDLVTKPLLPIEDSDGINKHIRGKLKPRLEWLFKTNRLPHALEDLSDCIREDGNDGAHDGTITESDAEELMEFTSLLLERIYTEPAKLEIARAKRMARRE